MLPGGSETYTFAMEWEYDSWNRIKQMTYPDGEVVTYGYDEGGQLFAMQGEKNSTPYPIIDTILYDKFGSRAYIVYGNGTKTRYEYEPYRRRLDTLKTFDGDQQMLMNLGYSYDNESNITGISNSAGIVNGLGGGYSYTFGYDDMYRLTSASGSFKNKYDYTLSMSYSTSGNITNKTLEALTLYAGGVEVPVDYDATYNYNPGRPHAIDNISGTNADHEFLWDENGNMTRHANNTAGLNRMLCWDEENRLTAVRDENNLSAYIYDAGGERVWKLTGQVQKMYIDGIGLVDLVDMNNKTLYASPYLVFNETGYSKHYYAGAERVSSRIGGGMDDALVDPLNYTVEILSGQNYAAIGTNLQDMVTRSIECTDMPMQYVSMEERLPSVEESTNRNDPEDNRYIYHSDHLGSSAFLTDIDGNPTQHLQYLPFGEPFIDQRTDDGYAAPYTFSAKERDPETGFSYFGARYYNSDISVWLSVDPMAGRFPYISPYSFVDYNPIRFTDFQGLFKISETFREQYPHFTEYLEKQIANDIQKGANILSALTKYGTFGSETTAIGSVKMDKGCDLVAVTAPGGIPLGAGGHYESSDQTIELSVDLIQQYENVMNNKNSTELDKQAALFAVFIVLMEENIHYGNDVYGSNVSNFQSEDNADKFEKEVFLFEFNNGPGGKMTPAERLTKAKQIINVLNKDPNGFNKSNLPTVPSSEAE